MEMTDLQTKLLGELRYAERLCQRSARLYRRVQACTTFVTIVGGSAAASNVFAATPPWLVIAGALAFTIFGAISLAVRPADKAAQNEQEAKRYAALRARASSLDGDALQQALDDLRVSDAAEIEPLRDVAYNDVVIELGQPQYVVPLRWHQRLASVLG